MTRPGVAWLCAGIAAVTTTAVLWTIRPQVGFDIGLGLIACEQHLAGRPNSLVETTVADPSDLRRDTFEVISLWPPGPQEIFCAVRRAGVPFERAVRTIVLGAWIVGLAAWAAYFVRVLGATAAAAWTIGLFALFRQSHAGVLVFTGGESLTWALCPVVVLMNIRALDAHRADAGRGRVSPSVRGVVAGVAATLLAIVKYSTAFMAIGLAAAWAWSMWRRDTRLRGLIAWSAGAALGMALATGAGLLTAMSHGTAANRIATNWLPFVVPWVAAGPLIGLSSTLSTMETVVTTLHVHALGTLSRESDEQRALIVAAIGWIVLLAIWARMTRPALASTARWIAGGRVTAWRVAVSIAVSISAGLGLLLARGGAVSLEDRHLQYGGFLLLPFLVAALVRGWALRRAAPRALAAAVALLAIGVPAMTGVATLVSQAFVRPPDAPRPSALRVDPAIVADLEAQPWVSSAVLATTPSLLPVSLPAQRVRWVIDSVDWADKVYRGAPAGGVALLLPAWVSDAEATTVQRAFGDVRTWERVPLEHAPGFQLWRGR